MPGCGPPGVYLAGRLAPDKRAALVGAIVKSGAAQARDLTRDVRLVVLQGEAAPKVLLARDKWGVPVVLAADAAALDAALQAAARSTVAPRHLTTAPPSKPKPPKPLKPPPPPKPPPPLPPTSLLLESTSRRQVTTGRQCVVCLAVVWSSRLTGSKLLTAGY